MFSSAWIIASGPLTPMVLDRFSSRTCPRAGSPSSCHMLDTQPMVRTLELDDSRARMICPLRAALAVTKVKAWACVSAPVSQSYWSFRAVA